MYTVQSGDEGLVLGHYFVPFLSHLLQTTTLSVILGVRERYVGREKRERGMKDREGGREGGRGGREGERDGLCYVYG